MDNIWIPAIILVMVIIFAVNPNNNKVNGANNAKEENIRETRAVSAFFDEEEEQQLVQNQEKVKQKEQNISSFNGQVSEDDLDYLTIYNYISNKFKKIPRDEAEEISIYIVGFSKEKEIDPKLTAALMERESGFNRYAVSRSGAKGLGQLMDVHFDSMNVKDPFVIKDNIRVMVNHFAYLIDLFKESSEKFEMAIACYLRGYGNIKRNGVDYRTNKYIDSVMNTYNKIKDFSKNYAKN